jgi:hypothetical protein
VGTGGIAFALGVVTCLWVRSAVLPTASAQPPVAGAPPAPAVALPQAPPPSSDYANRVVATLYGNVPVTREELGEYLIARYGGEKLEHLVNKRIVEDACKARNITVTAAEVEADLAETVKGLGINQSEFVSKVLKSYRKTLYEWKEDVIRPKLLMTRYCQSRVVVTPDDLQKAYEAHFGEKVVCRLIVWPKEERNRVLNDYARLRDDANYFDEKARHQASPTLAAKGGAIDPFGRGCFGGDPAIEQQIFRLQPGEVSSVIDTPDGVAVVKVDKHIQADTTVSINAVRERLTREIHERKVQAEIPRAFAQLREQAKPLLFIKDPNKPYDLTPGVKQALADGELGPVPGPQGPKTGGK